MGVSDIDKQQAMHELPEDKDGVLLIIPLSDMLNGWYIVFNTHMLNEWNDQSIQLSIDQTANIALIRVKQQSERRD